MSVWFSVVASISFAYMISPNCDLDSMRVIFAVLYSLSFFGGMFVESKRADKTNNEIKKLEREIKELKEKIKHIK